MLIANQLTLKQEVYPGLLRWAQYNHVSFKAEDGAEKM